MKIAGLVLTTKDYILQSRAIFSQFVKNEQKNIVYSKVLGQSHQWRNYDSETAALLAPLYYFHGKKKYNFQMHHSEKKHLNIIFDQKILKIG